MDIEKLNGQIEVKRTEIATEKDSMKKYKLQKQLQVLELKKQIASFKK